MACRDLMFRVFAHSLFSDRVADCERMLEKDKGPLTGCENWEADL